MSVPTNLIPTKITGLPEYTGTSQAGYFPYVLDGTTYKVQFSNVASAGEVPPSRTLTAGTGLTGGGDLSANRVFAIANGGVGAQQLDTTGVVAGVYGNGSNVPTVTVDANGRVTSVTTSPVVATGYVPESRTITAGTGLIGGGSLANNITLSLNISSATPQALGNATAGVSTAAARGDHVHPAVNLSDTNETQGALPLGRGGTGDALSPVAGAVVYSTGTKFALTNPGAVGQVLVSTGTDEPVWSFVGSGTVTSVNASGGSTGMTFTGGPITTSGTLTLGGTLATSSGGTGLTGTPTNGQLLIGNGTGYALSTLTAGTAVSITNAAGSITIDNTAPDQIVSLTAGTAISVTGTYPNFTIGNTAPDQIVSLTGAGTTTISGTYPNFTITSNDQFTGTVTSVAASGGTTGLTFSGSPITSAGTLTLGGTLAVANGGTGATDAPTARLNLGAAASGANSDITSLSGITGGISTADFVAFDTTNATPPTTGQLAWNVDDGTLDVGLLNNVVLQVGQEQMFYAKNTSGGTIPLGTPVMFTGAIGASGKITFGLAVANGSVPPEYMMGVTAQNVANNGFGYVATFGLVRGFDTSGTPYGETWADGDLLYFSPSTPGGWTKVEPQAPNIHVPVAVVVNAASGGSGSIFVRMIQSERLGELQDVEINGGGPAAGQVLIYDASQSRWENNTLTAGSNVTITNGNGSITIAATEQFTGTVTSVAASGGTTGLTFSGSPITSAGTLTLGGTLAIGSGGTGATTAGGARTALSAAASGANTDITSVALTSGTILNAPTSGTDIVNKAYADSIASGINFHQSVRLATVAPLPANTYNNGSSGVGATLTGNANGALSIDGVAVVAGNRVLVKDEVAQANNGVYVVTQTGSGSTPYILTRATDFDSAGSGVDQIDAGDFFLVTAGSTLANTSWVQQTPLPITVGTTAIVFSQFGAPVLYSAGTGLSLAGTVFSITNTGVSASTYGSASQVPVLAVNAQGQITSASNTSISIAASQVTSGSLAVAQGGTGLGTTPTNGQLLIGNGTGYSLSTLSAGTGISVSNGSGSVTVTNTAPDQIVTITGGGATVVTGTYPNFTVSTTTGTGTVTSVDVSGGSTGLSFTGGPITSSGIITMGGTLGVANGGTGATTLSSGYLLKGNGTSAVSSSVIFDNGTNAGIGTTTPQAPLAIGSGSASASNPTYGGSLLIASQMSSLAQTGGIEFRAVNFASGYGHRVSSPDLGAGDTPLVFERRTNSVSWTESMRINSAGNVIASVDVRAPIYYDSNNTAFYLDPTGSTSLNAAGNLVTSGNVILNFGANRYVRIGSSTNYSYDLQTTGDDFQIIEAGVTPRLTIKYPSGNLGVGTAAPAARVHAFTAASGNTLPGNATGIFESNANNVIAISAPTANAAGVFFPRSTSAYYAGIERNDTSLVFKNNDADRLTINSAGNVTANVDIRAPIFYDSNDTAFYVDPAGTSQLLTVQTSGDGFRSFGTPSAGIVSQIYFANTTNTRAWNWQLDENNDAALWNYNGSAWGKRVTVTSGSEIFLRNSFGYDTSLAYPSVFGYSSSYRTTVIGNQAYNTVCIGVSPASNPSGYFNGGGEGREVMFRNGVNFITPNSANNSYHFPLNMTDGYVTSSGSFRAPIFYDSQNTGYYVDPNGTSNLLAVGVDTLLNLSSGAPLFISSASAAYQRVDGRNDGVDARAHWYGVTTSGATSNFRHAWYDGAAYFNVTASGGQIYFERSGGATVNASGDFRAPIFYDSDNTAYYLDPASTGTALSTNGVLIAGTGTSGGVQNRTYTAGRNRIWSFNNADGYGLSYFQGGDDSVGLHFGTATAGSSQFIFYGSGYGQASGSFRAPIFYDSNDTGYYLDPNSTSNAALRIRGGALFGGNPTWGALLRVGSDGWVGDYSSVAVTNGNLHIDAQPGYQLYLAWYNNSDIMVGGGIQATIYYDRNNTAFFADPSSTSVLNALTVNGGATYRSDWTTRFQSNSDFVSGTLVTTDIPATAENGDSFVIEITGKSYDGSNPPFKVVAQGYLYANTIINYSGINYGGTFSSYIRVFQDGGVLKFWWPRISYWNSFNVNVMAMDGPTNGTITRNRVTSITDATEPTGTKKQTITLNQALRENTWINNKYFASSGEIFGTVFYDSNNSAYFLDANTTGNALRTAGWWRQDSTDWAGDIAGKIQYHANNWYFSAANEFIFRASNGSQPFYVTQGGVAIAQADMRAPIFYDSQNTGFYADPSDVSRLSAIYARGQVRATGWWGSYSASPTGLGLEIGQSGGRSYILSYNRDTAAYGPMSLEATDFTFTGISGGFAQIDTSFRAPIFYDSNNTAFYLDPASTSILNVVRATAIQFSNGNTAINLADPTYQLLRDPTGNIALYLGGADPQNYYDNSSHRFRSRGGAQYAEINANGMYAPVFYDSNNSGYYVDPNETSRTWRMGANYFQSNDFVSDDTPFGLYFDKNLSSAYAIFRESGAWTNPFPDLRISFHTGIKLGANASYQGIRFYTDYDMATQVMSVNNGSDGVGAGHVFVNNVLQAGGDLRAPIFYDSNSTAYYLDPTSDGTSLNVAGAIVAAGNVTAYSDIRVKDNVEQIGGALDRLQAIRGVTYTRNDLKDKERRYAGVIAQEIEAVLPEAVFESGDKKAVDYNATIGLLIEAIKELTARVAELEGK